MNTLANVFLYLVLLPFIALAMAALMVLDGRWSFRGYVDVLRAVVGLDREEP